jgi:hypothetical protein
MAETGQVPPRKAPTQACSFHRKILQPLSLDVKCYAADCLMVHSRCYQKACNALCSFRFNISTFKKYLNILRVRSQFSRNAMRTRNETISYLSKSLTYALYLLLVSCTGLQVTVAQIAQEVLRSGATVTVPAGQTWELPASGEVRIQNLIVHGTLLCPSANDRADVKVFVNVMTVDGGVFQCGSVDGRSPFLGKLFMEFGGTAPELIVQNGGQLLLTGRNGGQSWSRLANHLDKGHNFMDILKGSNWSVGDEVVVAPTDFDFDAYDLFRIDRVDSMHGFDRFYLNSTAQHTHYGTMQVHGGRPLENRAEVALLTRNIQIYGAQDSFEKQHKGVSINVQGKGFLRLDNVEIRNAGHFDTMGRYPVHWHLVGDGSNQSLTRSSIFRSLNRCLSVHCTDNVRVAQVACIDHVGHGFFLEDGSERGNVLSENLGMATRPGTGSLVVSDKPGEKFGPSTYWFANADNTFINNVAAGSSFFGFSLELEEPFRKATKCPERVMTLATARNTTIRQFSDNMAHSTRSSAFFIGDNYNPSVTARMTNLQAYRVRNEGNFPACYWANGLNIYIENVSCMDFSRALWLVYSTTISNGTLVAFSENKGEPVTPLEKTVGRSLASQDVSGHNVYDGPSSLYDLQFINFIDLPNSPVRSFHFDIFGGSVSGSKNIVSGLTFANPDVPKFRPGGSGIPRMLDLTGSVAGRQGGGVVMNKLRVDIGPDGARKKIDAQDILTADESCKPLNNDIIACGRSADAAFVVIRQPNRPPDGSNVDTILAEVNGKSRSLISERDNNFQFFMRSDRTYYFAMKRFDACLELELAQGIMNEVFEASFSWSNAKPTTGKVLVPNGSDKQINGVAALKAAVANADAAWFFDQSQGRLHVAVRMTQALPLKDRIGKPSPYASARKISFCLGA